MSRKLVLLIILVLVISSVISLSFHIPSANATISIEGHITSDTTWTPVDTYRVVNDTYIDSNASLTIEAGVHVNFDDNVSLIVEGGLNASGTESNPVIFTSSRVASNPPDPYAGAWKTIEFKGNSTEQLTLKHTKVEYAIHGITINSPKLATIEKSEITNCSESGIKLLGENNVLIRENNITKNKNGIAGGITTYTDIHSGIIFTNNIISENQENGIYLLSYTPREGKRCIRNVTFSSNTISSNGINGACLFAYGGGGRSDIYNVNFSSNTILENWGNGVYASAQDYCKSSIFNLILTNNTVLANKQKGVWINRVNANVSDNTLSHNLYGISLSSSSNSVISGNKIANNTYGVQLEDSSKNVVRQNIMSNNSYNFDLRSDELSEFVNWVGSSNLVDGKPVYYWINKHDAEVPLDAGYVVLVNCTNIRVRNLTLTKNNPGISLANTRNSTIFWNNIANNDVGISLYSSSYNAISGNNITENNSEGVYLFDSSDCNIVSGNNITNNSYGLRLLSSCSNNHVSGNRIANNNNSGVFLYQSCDNNTFFGNNITSNIDGIHLFNSSNNNISENHIVNNRNGTVLSNSSNNTFCHNNFINNSKQVIMQTPNITDFWDNGVEGNFWSNYIGVDSNRDGIGDTAYKIDENGKDNYPLMGVFSDFNATSEWHVQIICNSSISNFQFNGTAISFTATGENGTTSFCRMCVPKDLMDGPYIVLVNGEEVSHTLLSCSNNIHSYLYFAYNQSIQEILISQQSLTFEITQLLVVATALILIAVTLVVIIHKRKHNIPTEENAQLRITQQQSSWC
ncbi:MAG: right-handed parallel beta-helix repeat-containing protein [Candidatus Bathyarchaeota archaeon]|nr:right-handed parallel beta-helix repeat-containing protein [Candidatus Bathyarchaeota archaeon]